MFLFAPSHGVGRMPLWGLAEADASIAYGEYEDNRSAEELFQVTKAEFRRLTRQQEQLAARPPPPPPAATNATLARWCRPEPYVDAAEKIAGYRAELEASARAFCDRKKWAPLLHQPVTAGAAAAAPPRLQPAPAVDDDSVPSRPLSSGRRSTPPVRPATAAPMHRRSERTDAKRPLSAIANSRFADEVTHGAYDTLTPDVIRALNIRCDDGSSDRCERSRGAPTATTADGCGDASSSCLRPSPYALWTVDPLLKTTTRIATDYSAKGPCDLCRSGDVGSSGPSSRRSAATELSRTCGRAELSASPPMAAVSQSGAGWRTAARVKEPEAMANAEESEEEEEEEAEKATIHEAQARDRSRYDFEAGATPQPDYPFKDALSPALMAVDFASVATRGGTGDDDEKTSFDSIAIGDGAERKIATRLLHLARLQLATQREEDDSRRRVPTADVTEFARWPSRLRPRLMAAAAAAASGTRRRAAPGARACCTDCLQPACVGDCPEKRPRPRPSEADSGQGCPLCRRRSCAAGGCAAAEAATPYESHERRPDVAAEAAELSRRSAACATSGGVRRAASMRPRSCGPRLTRQTAAVSATYSAAEAADAARLPMPATTSSSRPPTAVSGRDGARRAPSGSPSSLTPTPKAVRCRSARLRGRDSVLPGKSFFSQRRRSLTGGDSGGCSGAARDTTRSSDRERRARSAKI